MANEVVMNGMTAEIVRQGGIDAVAEKQNPDGTRTDVYFEYGDIRFALEFERGTHKGKRAEAIEDADKKLDAGNCDFAVAAVYLSDNDSMDALRKSKVEVTLRMAGFQPEGRDCEWHKVDVDGLVDYIKDLPEKLYSPEGLARIAEIATKQAAECFTPEQQEVILLGMGKLAAGTNVHGLMVDLLTTMQFHLKLDGIRHKSFAGKRMPRSVRECLSEFSQNEQNFHEAWRDWLGVDYRAILEFACSIIGALPVTRRTNTAIKILAQAAMDMQSRFGADHHDVVGISFCQSMTTAKHEGSYYTTLPAATMLATLLFEDLPIDWSDYEQVTALRVADFACGTGTLLIAAANVIMQKEQTGRRGDVAKALVEQIIYGFDINPRAIHQAATGLAMMSPEVEFVKMNLYSMLLDIDKDGQAKLGSLELLQDAGNMSFLQSTATGIHVERGEVPVEPGTLTVGILNPPYTRNQLKHKHLDKQSQVALNKRAKQLYGDLPIVHSSNGNGFIVMAEKYLDKGIGRLGFVSPTAMTTNSSGLEVRRWLAERFHIKYLVISYDPQRVFMSGNTGIGEYLAVLERKRPGEQSPTKVVKLLVNPGTASDAYDCAMGVLCGKPKGAFVAEISAEKIKRGDWMVTQFASNELCEIAENGLWDASLENQVEVTSISRSIRGVARKCDKSDKNATPCLFHHKSDYCLKLEVEPDSYVCPKEGNAKAMMYLQRTHSLKLPERLNVQVVKTMVCRTSVPTVGNAWQNGVVRKETCGNYPIEDVEKAICLILNSTPGKIGMLYNRNRRSEIYPQFNIDNLLRIPLPRIASLGYPRVKALAGDYDRLCHLEKKSLRDAHNCPVQKAIDEAVADSLDFSDKEVARMRELLAKEPMVSGKRYSE